MKKWYAVQTSREDDWSNGSYNYDEAVQMLKEQGCGLIAVIEEVGTDACCIEEIKYEEVH